MLGVSSSLICRDTLFSCYKLLGDMTSDCHTTFLTSVLEGSFGEYIVKIRSTVLCLFGEEDGG